MILILLSMYSNELVTFTSVLIETVAITELPPDRDKIMIMGS